MSNIFAAVAKSAVKGGSERNPWSVQVDLEKASGAYIHPVTGEAISLGGAVVAALGNAGKVQMPNGITFREAVQTVLKANGYTFRSFRKISLDDKIALHAAITKPRRSRKAS